MIYGDPIILGGGGSGGPTAQDAILLATVPAGSTATATKNGVTVTPTLWVSAADSSLETALFVFSPAQFDNANPWTITATDGTDTASDTVLITTNKEYEITLTYRVPSAYQEVEYLQSSGAQWIDTGYKFQPNIAIDIDFYWLALNYDTDIIGSDGGSGSICILLNRYNSNKNRAVINQVVENWSSQEYALNTLYSASIQSASGATNIVINGDAWNTLSQTVTSAYTLSLFGRKTSNGAGNLATCRIYSCNMTQGGTPVREFIPCYRKADSVAGMWERVNGEFYTNDGTGLFVVGPDVN